VTEHKKRKTEKLTVRGRVQHPLTGDWMEIEMQVPKEFFVAAPGDFSIAEPEKPKQEQLKSCMAPWCGIDGKYGNPGVCNAPGGHKYKPNYSYCSCGEKFVHDGARNIHIGRMKQTRPEENHNPTDENGCYTLPNGECISKAPCLHTKPASEFQTNPVSYRDDELQQAKRAVAPPTGVFAGVKGTHVPLALGWSYFGTHANYSDPDSPCSYGGDLEFSESGEDGLPNWERHADGSDCPAAIRVFPSPSSEMVGPSAKTCTYYQGCENPAKSCGYCETHCLCGVVNETTGKTYDEIASAKIDDEVRIEFSWSDKGEDYSQHHDVRLGEESSWPHMLFLNVRYTKVQVFRISREKS
jgi:hypothetical protein